MTEVATRGVLVKKKCENFAIFPGKHMRWSLLKRNSNTGVFLLILPYFKKTYFEENLQTAASVVSIFETKDIICS